MPSMLRASFLESILPLTGDEAEARPKVSNPLKQLPELLGVFLAQGRDTTRAAHHLPFPKERCGLSALWKPLLFPSPRSGSAAGTAARGPGEKQERAWWRLPHRMSCRVPTVCPLRTHSPPARAPQIPPQSHPVTELRIETGSQDSRTNQSPLRATNTNISPFSPISCICSICPHTPAGDTKPVVCLKHSCPPEDRLPCLTAASALSVWS